MAEQISGVVAQHFVQMGGDGGGCIDHGVTQGARMVALRWFDPHGFQAECGFLRWGAFQRAIDLARVDGHFAAHLDLAAPAHHAFENHVVRVGVDAQCVADAHRLNQKAQLCRELLAHTLNAGHQLPAGLGVHQRNQAVTDFQADQVHLIQVFPVQFLRCFHGRLRSRFGRLLGGFFVCLAAQNQQAGTGCHSRQGHKHQMRHSGYQAQDRQDAGGHEQRAGVTQLGGGLLGYRFGCGHPGHDDGGGQRQEQGWNLSDQAVADGQQRINLARFAQGQAMLSHADSQTTNQVDKQNQDARYRVAADKFGSTVHGAKEIGLLPQFGAPCFGGFLVDHASIQIGVNRHLLTRHGI